MKIQSFKNFLSEEEKKKTGDEEAYQKYFNKMLKKWGVDSPEDLSDADKKKFFDAVDKGWKSDKEQGSKATNESSEDQEDSLEEDIGRMLKVKTKIGNPKITDSPRWANFIGRTPEGAWHWLEKYSEVETDYSDEYFPDAGKTEFTGFISSKKNKEKVVPLRGNRSLEERSITIKDERQLLKALQDLEVNLKGKARTTMSIATEELEDKGLDHDVASKIEDAISVLPGNFSQNALVDAVVDYVEENL